MTKFKKANDIIRYNVIGNASQRPSSPIIQMLQARTNFDEQVIKKVVTGAVQKAH